MKIRTTTLRCADNAEAVVFNRYDYKQGDISYEINIEDSYVGGDYQGFIGRFKRAWRAFWDKPVIYTGVFCEDKNEMEKFLQECFSILNQD